MMISKHTLLNNNFQYWFVTLSVAVMVYHQLYIILYAAAACDALQQCLALIIIVCMRVNMTFLMSKQQDPFGKMITTVTSITIMS